MTKEKTKKVGFSRHLGKNVADLISRLVISGTIPAIEELVVNSYDADATKVEVAYFQEKDELVIEDNGAGMRKEKGLESFYRLGDSPKIAEPVSPRGRVRIGKFGVGTILLDYLCKEYELSTARDGVRTTIEEKFDGVIKPEKSITGEEVQEDLAFHGTRLTLRGLKFKDDPHFSVDELKKRFQWHLPILPDFEVAVNGQSIKPKSIENATKFRIDTSGESMGHVSGEINLTGRTSPMAGMYIYVNGRSIGDSKAFLARIANKRSLVERIVGIVHADDLEHAILFDRGRFREDDPGVIELGKTLGKALAKIRGYIEQYSGRNLVNKLGAKKEVFAKKAKDSFVRAGVPGITRATDVEFSPDFDAEVPGGYDSERNIIIINSKHPSLMITPTCSPQKYERAILEAAVDALSYAPVNERFSLASFLSQRAEVWKRLNETDEEQSHKQDKLNPMRVYRPGEISSYVGRSSRTVKDLISAGVLPGTSDEVFGQDALETEEKLTGLVALYDLLAKKIPVNAIAIFMERADNIFALAGDTRSPFVHDISRNGSPCYLVEGTCADNVYELFDNPMMDLRRKEANPAKVFQEFGDSFYTIPQLAQQSQGITIPEVVKILDHSKRSDLPMEKKNLRGGYVAFRYGDFVRSLQSHRGNDAAIRRNRR